ncbi:RNA methyltransferase [Actinomycetaceae bacterium TAE3-ERU4]|nr:RNA methyltransferase [Actinomycetaceae bacterium TAE3-ERU4]
MLVEGPQAVRELVSYYPQAVRDIYVDVNLAATSLREIVEQARKTTDFVHPCTSAVVDAISRDAQGICAVAELSKLSFATADTYEPQPGVALLMARVQDPGNVGTIIRVGDAFGASTVFASSGSADLTSPKVIRSTAGSAFHLNLVTGQFSDLIKPLKNAGYKVIGTSGSAELSLDDLLDSELDMLKGNLVWVMGNEARGLSEDEAELCDYLVRIPLVGKAESLNVASAAAVVMSATARVRRVAK